MADRMEETNVPEVPAPAEVPALAEAPAPAETPAPAEVISTAEAKSDDQPPQKTEGGEKKEESSEVKGEKQEEKKEEKKEVKKEGPKFLDLAFAMDCTGSMGSYIHQAQQNIRMIVEEIVAKESADIHLALVEYRDHPPQDSSFVTRVHDFTSSMREMKKWLNDCSASGGGDGPEAVADALHQVLKLNWRPEATKICVFISDAPPHGLGGGGDGFPNGCPAGLDPMEVTNQLTQKGVIIYLVGCEPSINPYREFFTALAHVTGGQYVPLRQAKLLAKVIVGGAQEEMSLQEMMEEINKEVMAEAAQMDEIDEDALTTKLHTRYQAAGKKTKQLRMNKAALPKASARAEQLSYCANMAEVRKEYVTELEAAEFAPRERRAYSKTVGPISTAKSKKKTGGGFFSKMFGSLSSSTEGAAAPEPMIAACAAARMDADDDPMDAMGTGDYEVEEEADIDISQVSRMVHKTVVSNKMTERIKKK